MDKKNFERSALMNKLNGQIDGHMATPGCACAKMALVNAVERHYCDQQPQRVLIGVADETVEIWRLCRGVSAYLDVPLWYWNTQYITKPEMVDAAFYHTLNKRDKMLGNYGVLGIIYLSDTEELLKTPEATKRLIEAIQGKEIVCESGRTVNTRDLLFVFGSTKKMEEFWNELPAELRDLIKIRADMKR